MNFWQLRALFAVFRPRVSNRARFWDFCAGGNCRKTKRRKVRFVQQVPPACPGFGNDIHSAVVEFPDMNIGQS